MLNCSNSAADETAMQQIFPMDFQNDKHIAWECEVASRFFSILKYMVFVGEGVECRYIFLS